MMTTYVPDMSITSGFELDDGGGPDIVACSRSLVSESGTSSGACLALSVMLPRSMRGLVPSSGFLGRVWVRAERRGMGRGRWLVTKYDKNFLFGVPTTTTAANHSCMDIAQNLLNAYEALGRRVHETLRIQHGDVTRLRAQIDEVKAFAADAGRVCLAFF
jgi:hypothetical protein